MLKRLLVAAIFLPMFVWVIYIPGRLPFFLLALLGFNLAAVELGSLARRRGLSVDFAWLVAFTTLVCLAAGWFGGPAAGLNWEAAAMVWLLVLGALLTLSLKAVFAGFQDSTVSGVSVAIMTLVIIAGIGSFVLLIHRLPLGPHWIVLLFGFNWLYDSGAMIGGMLFGRTKLAPSISPAKTVEGLVTGLLVNVAAAVAVHFWWVSRNLGFSLAGIIGLGVLLGLLAQAGDLVESMVKRWAGTKDASQLIPGHGGLLDKIDNLLFTAPVLYVIACLMQLP
ncbi:MAG: phosphatidate cytidylyltransferase [candidate division FCPU426 bacterium]